MAVYESFSDALLHGDVSWSAQYARRGVNIAGSVWTLAMIRHHIEGLLSLLRSADELHRQLSERAVPLPGGRLTLAQRHQLRRMLIDGEPNFMTELSGIDALGESVTLVTNFYDRVGDAESASYTVESAAANLQSLIEHTEMALSQRTFLYLSPDDAARLEKKHVLSREARESFRSSTEELLEAEHCLALGRWTACVFHAMRGVECAVRAFGVAVLVGTPDEQRRIEKMEVSCMGEILNIADQRIADVTRNEPRTRERERRLQFWGKAAQEFSRFNHAWRKYAAHDKATYGESDAKNVLEHTCAFIESLAKRGLREN